MSFVKTLATLSVGFAAARGAEKAKQMGDLDAMQDAMKKATGGEGGLGDQLSGQMSEMADKMGLTAGKDAMENMMNMFNQQTKGATEAAEAGMAGVMSAMTGAAAAGASGMSSLFEAFTAGTPLATMAEENARLMIRAMVQSAKADGEIDTDEQAAILEYLTESSPEEIAFVAAELNAPIDVNGLAMETGEAAKAQVYSAALMAISVNTEPEKQYLRGLASALALGEDKVASIHEAMGKPSV